MTYKLDHAKEIRSTDKARLLLIHTSKGSQEIWFPESQLNISCGEFYVTEYILEIKQTENDFEIYCSE